MEFFLYKKIKSQKNSQAIFNAKLKEKSDEKKKDIKLMKSKKTLIPKSLIPSKKQKIAK